MNTQNVIIIAIAFVGFAMVLAKLMGIRRAFIVPEGYAGLLYHQGQFVETLKARRHIRWGFNYTIDAVDFRKAFLNVPGQEVLTSDGVGLKVSVLIHYQMTDPVKASHDTQNWQTDIYNYAQLALRAVVGNVAVEAVLTQRLDIGGQLLARVQPDAAKIGIHVLAVEVKDVMFPADIKRAFAEVLKAKHEGHAALERARGESAALRNLANVARVLDDNPSLMNLRLLQSISAAKNAGNTLVLGMPTGFVPTKNGKSKSEKESGET